jgi:Asparagine synthase
VARYTTATRSNLILDKTLLRAVMSGRLPNATVRRPKQGFMAPQRLCWLGSLIPGAGGTYRGHGQTARHAAGSGGSMPERFKRRWSGQRSPAGNLEIAGLSLRTGKGPRRMLLGYAQIRCRAPSSWHGRRNDVV